MKYKQQIIPSVTTPQEWQKLKLHELRRVVFEYVRKNYAGKTYENLHTKLKIQVSVSGGRKTAFGEAMYRKKAATIFVLPEILQYAVYNNFGNRKENDSESIIGYLNFKCKCKIDGQLENLRIAIQFQRGGKYYYSIEVNKKQLALERSKA